MTSMAMIQHLSFQVDDLDFFLSGIHRLQSLEILQPKICTTHSTLLLLIHAILLCWSSWPEVKKLAVQLTAQS